VNAPREPVEPLQEPGRLLPDAPGIDARGVPAGAGGGVRATARFVLAAAFAAGCSWGACRFGRFVAADAGMSSQSLGIEAFPLLLAGLLCGTLLRLRLDRRGRAVLFVAVATGAGLGLLQATHDGFDAFVRWSVFALPAACVAFARSVSRWT
jgi:hypothetical protein